MKFKLKKKEILKLEISTFKSFQNIILSLCEFNNFYTKFTENYELKKMENFFLTLLVCNVPKLNLRKFLTIYCESLKLSL